MSAVRAPTDPRELAVVRGWGTIRVLKDKTDADMYTDLRISLERGSRLSVAINKNTGGAGDPLNEKDREWYDQFIIDIRILNVANSQYGMNYFQRLADRFGPQHDGAQVLTWNNCMKIVPLRRLPPGTPELPPELGTRAPNPNDPKNILPDLALKQAYAACRKSPRTA